MRSGDKLLRIWGRWANERIGTEYPSRSMLICGADVIRKPRRYNDDVAEKVDRICNRLQNRDAIAFEIVKQKYIHQVDLLDIARGLRLSLSSVKNRLREAQYFIEGGFSFLK